MLQRKADMCLENLLCMCPLHVIVAQKSDCGGYELLPFPDEESMALQYYGMCLTLQQWAQHQPFPESLLSLKSSSKYPAVD